MNGMSEVKVREVGVPRAARYLGLTRQGVSYHLNAGRLRGRRVGMAGRWAIRVDELREFGVRWGYDVDESVLAGEV